MRFTVFIFEKIQNMEFQFQNYKLDIFVDDTYSFDSTDNKNHYDHIYPNENSIYQGASLAFVLKENDRTIKSAVVKANSKIVTISKESLVVKENKLWILVANEIFLFELSTFSFIKNKELDMGANFAIYNLVTDFLVHGEMEIFRITKELDVIWQFSGADMWVNLNGKKEVQIFDNNILLTDFNDANYTLDFDGNLI
jgi:hypothetical protein